MKVDRGFVATLMARASTIVTTMISWAAMPMRRRLDPRRRWRVPAWRRFASPGLFTLIAIAVLMVVFDATVIRAVTKLPPWVIAIFNVITDFGRSGWLLIPLALLYIATAAAASPRLGRVACAVLAAVAVRLGFMFVAIGLPGLIVTILKRWIGRARPSHLGPFAYEPFSWRPEFASLPSGHATTAFAALVAIGFVFRRARPVLWIYALLIAISRVIVSAHYPSDVVAGAAFGALGALLVRDWFAARRLGFYIASNGGVNAMPGPSLGRIKRVARAAFGQ